MQHVFVEVAPLAVWGSRSAMALFVDSSPQLHLLRRRYLLPRLLLISALLECGYYRGRALSRGALIILEKCMCMRKLRDSATLIFALAQVLFSYQNRRAATVYTYT